MAPSISVTPRPDVWGYDVVIGFTDLSGVGQVFKQWTGPNGTGGGRVRGYSEFPVDSGTVTFTDYEVPVDVAVSYAIVQIFPDESIEWAPTTAAALTTEEIFVVRDLFSLEVSFIDDVAVGTLQDEESENRLGLFTVLGRADPVPVLDVRQTTTSTLVFLPKTDNQLKGINILLNSGSPLLVQYPSSYLIGKMSNLIYIQPGRITRRRLLPDGRTPIRRIEVEYTEIAPPPIILQPIPSTNTYADLLVAYPTYLDLLLSGHTYLDLVYGDL